MSLAYLRPRTQILISVLVPAGAIALGLFLLWPSLSRLRRTNRELESTQKAIKQKLTVISQAEAAAAGRSLALAVALPDEHEPVKFLRQLAALAAESNVTLASVRETTPPPLPAATSPEGSGASGSPAGPPSSPVANAALGGERPVVPPTTVVELTNEVSAEGAFGDLLSLLVRLEGFERILSVSQCRTKSGSDYPRLQTVFTLSRFVGRPEAPSPGPGAEARPATAAR